MSIRKQYGVKRKLGQALYGDVWLCTDAHAVDQQVALKEVKLRTAKHALAINPHMDNPWQERKIAEELQQLGPHANVLAIYDNFIENGSWFMAMEYCEGGDLLSLVQDQNDGRLQESVALEVFQQVASGVQFLHSNGIAHRDLSLENVLLRDRTCKLSDFGLSTDAKRVCSERVGKTNYMAPEVVQAKAYDPRAADMWSLGIMLFIMLTGSPVVQEATRADKGFLALQGYGVDKILDVWGLSNCISTAAKDLMAQLLQVDPAARPTVDQVLRHPVFHQLVVFP